MPHAARRHNHVSWGLAPYPQGGLGLASNLRRRTELGLAHLLREESTAGETIAETRDGAMSVMGSGVASPGDAAALEDAARDGRLKAVLAGLGDRFDYVFLDAAAGVGRIVDTLFAASDGVILMVRCRSLLLKSLPLFLKLVRDVRSRSNPRLLLEGALMTMRNISNPFEERTLEDLRQSVPTGLFFRTVIPYDDRFEEASLKAVPVSLIPEGRGAARPYLELAIEMKERRMLRRSGGGADDYADGLF